MAFIFFVLFFGLNLYSSTNNIFLQSDEKQPLSLIGKIYDHLLVFDLTQQLMDETIDPEQLALKTEKILKQKPKNQAIYYLACVVFAFEHKQPERCLSFILRGMEVFPDSFKLPMLQGFVLASVLNHPYEAHLFYEAASKSTKSPAYVKQFFIKHKDLPISKIEQKHIYELMLSLPEGSYLKYLIEKRQISFKESHKFGKNHD